MGKMSLHDCRKHYKIALSMYVQCVKAVKKEEGWQGEKKEKTRRKEGIGQGEKKENGKCERK